MSVVAQIGADLNVQGVVYCTQLNASQACVTNAMISASTSSPIGGSKVAHQNVPAVSGYQLFDLTTNPSAKTLIIGRAKSAGTIKSVDIFYAGTAATTGTASVNLKKSTGGGAFATVLSATVDITSATATLTAVAGIISAAPYVAGDVFELVVTVSGSPDGKGLTAVVVMEENPQ